MTNPNNSDAVHEPPRSSSLPVLGGLLGALYGGLGLIVGIGYLQMNTFGFGNNVSVATPSVGAGILLLFFVPAYLPAIGIAFAMDTWGMSSDAAGRGVMFLVGNAVLWYGLGSFFHGLGCSPRKWLPEARRKGLKVGLVTIGIGVLIVMMPYIVPGIFPHQSELSPQKVQAPARPPERVMKSGALDVSIDGANPITLKRRPVSVDDRSRLATGREELTVFHGRESRWVGSRDVEVFCQTQPAAVAIEVAVEGSLSTKAQMYCYEGEGELLQQEYQLRSEDGQHMAVDIQTVPRYEDREERKPNTLSDLWNAFMSK